MNSTDSNFVLQVDILILNSLSFFEAFLQIFITPRFRLLMVDDWEKYTLSSFLCDKRFLLSRSAPANICHREIRLVEKAVCNQAENE